MVMTAIESAKQTAKELLASIKGIFDGAPPAPQAPAPAATAPAAPSAPAPVVYTLADGSQIAIQQAGALPAVGDLVTVAGAPAPEGVLTLADGTLITVDATGAITQYTPVAPAAAAAPPAAPPAPAPTVPVTQTQMTEHIAKFAVGDIESRVANLEIVAKGLVESEFGYQISCNERLESTNAAIAVYQTTLANQELAMKEQEKTIVKYGETIKGLFDLVEKLVELPVAAPVTLVGLKKEKFDKNKEKEDKLEKIAAAIKEMRKGK